MEECDQQLREVARLGSNVLIDLNGRDRFIFARLHPSASLKVGNSMCSLAPLIDAPYGSAFELQRGSLVRIPPPLTADSMESQDPQQESSVESMQSDMPVTRVTRDNRSLVDDNTAQKLSAEDIDRMRADCASGKEIVDALIANSTTFQSKTAYSQEKYKRRKQKKYAPFFVIRRPSTRRVCEAYAVKCPPKIGFLRMDTVALMLSLANVGAHAEVLVMDMVSGLLTAAVAERMGGFGSVCSVYCTAKPSPLDIVGLLNLTPSMASRVFRVSFWELISSLQQDASPDAVSQTPPLKEACEGGTDGLQKDDGDDACVKDVNINNADGIETMDFDKTAEPLLNGDTDMCSENEQNSCIDRMQIAYENIKVASSCEETLIADAKEGSTKEDIGVRTKKSNIARYGKKPESEDLSRWAKHGFTGLLISASEYEPWSVAQKLFPLLSPSASFAIHHRYMQPLVECMHQLQINRMAVALEIVEPWLREYQVLPSRTHPHMQMSATGGYVLTGIKTVSI